MNIKIERTNKQLSSHGGLVLAKNLMDRVGMLSTFKNAIPGQKRGLSRNLHKVEQLVLGFVAGADCLDDFVDLERDPGFRAICEDKVYTPKSIGDLLRSFRPVHSREFNRGLIKSSLRLRHHLAPDRDTFVLDIDSTANRQHGKKMEGAAFNYGGIWGLDTIQGFDEFGLQYWTDVRPGNTHTSRGSLEIIHEVFNAFPESMSHVKRQVRADSGYCKLAFFNACQAKGAEFVVCMRKMMYRTLIGRVSEWEKQDRSDPKRIVFLGGRECEIGEATYRSRSCHFDMRAIILRAVKKECEEQAILGQEDYDYYAWVTNKPLQVPAAEIVKFYRGRGHAENFIRELKNGFDLRHYPCQKLLANKAYALIGAFSYNLLRFLALKENPQRPKFAKQLRTKLMRLACQVVRHAGGVAFRFMSTHFQEVSYWLKTLKHIQLGSVMRESG